MGAGTILNEVRAAAKILKIPIAVEANIWSLTSVNEMVREGQAVDRWNLLHPAEKPKESYITEQLGDSSEAQWLIATDYMKNYAEQMRAYIIEQPTALFWVPMVLVAVIAAQRCVSFFEVDRYFIGCRT